MTDLEQLLADLNDPDWLVRANAAEALGKLAGLPEWQANSNMTHSHLTNALMHTLSFTEDELVMNRAGKLSRSQRTRLRNLGGQTYMLRNIWLGLLVTVGGFGAAYVFVHENEVLGAILAVILIVATPITMVRIARSSMDEEQLRKWGKLALITNAILGVLAIGSFLIFGYMFMSAADTTPDSIKMPLVVGTAMVLLGPLLHLLRSGWRKPMISVEGYAEVEPEGPGPEREELYKGLGMAAGLGVLDASFVANAGLFVAVQVRNMLAGPNKRNSREAQKFVLSYSIRFGKHKFYTTKEIGRSFVDGAYYRLYCARAYPMAMLISGEAVKPPPDS